MVHILFYGMCVFFLELRSTVLDSCELIHKNKILCKGLQSMQFLDAWNALLGMCASTWFLIDFFFWLASHVLTTCPFILLSLVQSSSRMEIGPSGASIDYQFCSLLGQKKKCPLLSCITSCSSLAWPLHGLFRCKPQHEKVPVTQLWFSKGKLSTTVVQHERISACLQG